MASCKKIASVILAVAVVAAGVAVYFGFLNKTQTTQVAIDGVVLPSAQTIHPFKLTDNHGKTFTQENLNGHWTMMFFGFTNCGMVCPTTLAALSDMYKMLGKELPADKMPQVVMVSVDPERDNVKRLDDYVAAFNTHFIGTRAEIADTVALENQLHIAAAKIQTDDQGKDHYTINHSAEILLFNPDGKLLAYLSYPHHAEQMAKDYQAILAAGSS